MMGVGFAMFMAGHVFGLNRLIGWIGLALFFAGAWIESKR